MINASADSTCKLGHMQSPTDVINCGPEELEEYQTNLSKGDCTDIMELSTKSQNVWPLITKALAIITKIKHSSLHTVLMS